MAALAEHSPRLVGRYILYGELASGGMATVHFGRLSGPVGFSRTVAIKRLHPHFAKDPEFVTMFLDEARLCGRIRHPNVVSTLDVVAEDGELFIVMEYVAGEALSKLMKVAAAMGVQTPPRVAATILSSVLHGLHAAHQTKDEHGRALGIVHRDVSPQNVLVGTDGSARVLDFGVAKAAGRLQTTRDGQVKGKIAYMPPEQLSGAPLTKQVDVYASAVVLWELLAGRRLFDGETETVVLARALEGKVGPPSAHNPLVDAALDAVVLRGLAREPGERFATAREMALAIEQSAGLASPSEVAEWVERIAGAELARRAQTVAAIEVASLSALPSSTRMTAARPLPGEPHSQVSSISVSRPALSVAPTAKGSGAARWLIPVFILLACVGGGFGASVMAQVFAPARRGDPRLVAGEPKRPLVVLPPSAADAKAKVGSAAGERPKEGEPAAAPTPTPPPRHAAPTPPPPPPAPKPSAKPAAMACDPPYSIDPTTGRKKYKLECLK